MPKTVKELLQRKETCIRCGGYAEPAAWCKVRGERCGMVEDERRGCAALRSGASCACGYLHAYDEEKKP